MGSETSRQIFAVLVLVLMLFPRVGWSDGSRPSISVKTRSPYRGVMSSAGVSSSGAYRRCFKGCAAVEWMIKQGEAMDEVEALEVGDALLSEGIVYRCGGGPAGAFEDSQSSYYRFSYAIVHRKRAAKEKHSALSTKSAKDAGQEETEAVKEGGRGSTASPKKMPLTGFVNDPGDDDEDKEGEEGPLVWEETYAPAKVRGLARRMRSDSDLVMDRHHFSATSGGDRGVLAGFREALAADETTAVAYPRTFFGCDAVGWMVSNLGLVEEEDALVVGDVMLHLNLVREVEPIDYTMPPEMSVPLVTNDGKAAFQVPCLT